MNYSVFDEAALPRLVVAILVHKLGGQVTITQEDFDKVAFARLDERHDNEADTIEFRVQQRPLAA